MSAYLDRITRLRSELDSAEVDGILISQPESRYYLSGYRGHDTSPRDSAGYLLISREETLLFTDGRTRLQAEREAPDYEVSIYLQGASPGGLIAQAAERLGLMRLGFESLNLPFFIFQTTMESLNGVCEFVPLTGLVESLRMIKDPNELGKIQDAIDVLDDCFTHLLGELRPGRTEREIAWEVEIFLRSHGAEGTSFRSIVASGPNASVPHAVPTVREMQAGEPIKIDIGALVDGYCSDMTRTVCIGKAPSRLREIYEIVLAAQKTAERSIRPGMTGRDVDRIARGVIEQAGFGDKFGHGLGHGIGLEVHEPPWITEARGVDELRPGMVFSIEPGIYIAGWGGVRIEDLVLMEEQSARVLSGSVKVLEFQGNV